MMLLFVTCLCLHLYGAQHPQDYCDPLTDKNIYLQSYFQGMSNIYKSVSQNGTCLPLHQKCGWPKIKEEAQKLPMLVLSVGLEGAGHHLWTELLQQPVFDCIWINARHYNRDVADGVPRTTVQHLMNGFKDQFQFRSKSGKPPCKNIYDAEDSFPTGAIRKNGRVFMRPDIINLHQLDGVLFNIKYLVIIRNTTDTALSALRRNFFAAVDQELRTVEHTLTYIESAFRGIPCHKIFIAHYEHVLAEPRAFIEPLSIFLELDSNRKEALKKRLQKKGFIPSRKAHKLTQYDECKSVGITDEKECYDKINALLEEFFVTRQFMWPTFAGNGFDFT